MMKKFLLLLIALLPLAVFAQSKPSEVYWLYYTPDSTAFMERVYEWGGYKDFYYYNDHTIMRANAPEKYRRRYDSSCMEYAKTLVFYTKKELEREPVKLKPGDTFNLNRRKKN
ncbi:MAG: hypothetical protein VZR95_09195 [Alphaproteobacteria bacterium]